MAMAAAFVPGADRLPGSGETGDGFAAGTGHRSGAEAFVRFCVAEYPSLTDQDMPATAADLEAIIDRCARGEAVDWDGTALVLDEAAYFFAGEKTEEETAGLIQQRVSLYLMEQQEAP